MIVEANADLELATERFDVLAEGAEAHVALVLDLAHAGLADAHELRQLLFGNLAVLAQGLEEFVLLDQLDQSLSMGVDPLAALGGQVFDETAKRLCHSRPPVSRTRRDIGVTRPLSPSMH